MCWIGELFLHTADKDIQVYKIVRLHSVDTYLSVYREFPYTRGNTYHSKIIVSNNYSLRSTVNKALHSYSEEMTRVENKTIDNGFKELSIKKKGKIYFKNPIDYHIHRGDLIKIPCIIPKGAKYCINNDGEIISDTLKIL